jgi:DUF1009 family protein
MNSIGIVAGAGSLPLEVLEGAKREGFSVHVCAIKNEADEKIARLADSCEWVRVGELSKLIKYFQQKQISQVVFAGKIHKLSLLRGEVRPDLTMLALFASVKSRKDNTLLGTIANHLTAKGLEVIDSTRFLKESLPKEGVLTNRKPTLDEMENVRFGFETAKKIAGLDIGQTVAVKDMSVVAVESVEGTDACIRRGGELAGGGIIAVKVAKPRQDMRFDVPAVGLNTLAALKEAKGRVLAFEAGKTILMDRKEFLRQAEKMKLAVIAYEPRNS